MHSFMSDYPDQPAEVLLRAPDGHLYCENKKIGWEQVDDLNWYVDVPKAPGIYFRARGGEVLLKLVHFAESNNPYMAIAWEQIER